MFPLFDVVQAGPRRYEDQGDYSRSSGVRKKLYNLFVAKHSSVDILRGQLQQVIFVPKSLANFYIWIYRRSGTVQFRGTNIGQVFTIFGFPFLSDLDDSLPTIVWEGKFSMSRYLELLEQRFTLISSHRSIDHIQMNLNGGLWSADWLKSSFASTYSIRCVHWCETETLSRHSWESVCLFGTLPRPL